MYTYSDKLQQQQKFEDTTCVIRNCILIKDRQCNGQRKNDNQ